MSETSSDEFQKFLDQNQYTQNGILRYEKIFGRGFVSTGGSETTKVSNQKARICFSIFFLFTLPWRDFTDAVRNKF